MVCSVKYKIANGFNITERINTAVLSGITVAQILYYLSSKTGLDLKDIFIVDIEITNDSGNFYTSFIELEETIIFKELANHKFPLADVYRKRIWIPGPIKTKQSNIPFTVLKNNNQKKEKSKKYKYKAISENEI